jgi:hypothetical protein
MEAKGRGKADSKKGMPWKVRIVGYGVAVPDQLLANPKNYRIHPFSQQEALKGILDDVGYIQNIIVNKRTSEKWSAGNKNVETVLDGHLRVMMAISHGDKEIPVTYVDLTPDEEALVLATIDPLSAMAIVDREKLSELLDDVHTNNEAVQDMLADLAKNSGIRFEGAFEEPDMNEESEDEPEDEPDNDDKNIITCPSCGHKFSQSVK